MPADPERGEEEESPATSPPFVVVVPENIAARPAPTTMVSTLTAFSRFVLYENEQAWWGADPHTIIVAANEYAWPAAQRLTFFVFLYGAYHFVLVPMMHHYLIGWLTLTSALVQARRVDWKGLFVKFMGKIVAEVLANSDENDAAV